MINQFATQSILTVNKSKDIDLGKFSFMQYLKIIFPAFNTLYNI